MKLMDWIDRAPVRVSFGGGGGSSGAFDIARDATSLSLVTASGIETDLPPATGFDAGLMSASDKTKLDGLANTTVAVDPSNFESRAQVAATSVDPGVTFIRTAGYNQRGDGGSALYVRVDVEPTHGMKIQSADGAHWEFVPENGVVSEKQAGGVGDGVADDTQAIQMAIDFAIYENPPTNSAQPVEVLILGPRCLITDTIHLGYGEAIHGVNVRGIGRKRRGESVYVGTALIATFTDRPIVNFQGIRGGLLRDIWIEGALDFSGIDFKDYSITLETTWDALGGNGRYNPYAGISVDAFSGPRPVGSYPDANYPDFLGVQPQYDKVFSSDIRIENIGVRRVNTALVLQPGDHDANGDFLKVVNCNFEDCKYGISIGNGQSRNVEIRNLLGAGMFVTFANDVHGRRSGRFGGPIENVSLGRFIGRVFEFGSTTELGTTLFTTLYVESMDRIGDLVGDTSSEGALTFDSCLFSFRHNDDRGHPANIIGNTNSSDIVFRGCRFVNAPSVYSFKLPRVTMIQCSASPSDRDNGTVPLFEAFAHNATSGGVVLDPLNLRPQQIRFSLVDLETGVIGDDIGTEEGFYQTTGRDRCIPLAIWEFARQSERYSPPTRKRFNYYERTRGVHFSSVDLTGRTLTLEFVSLSDHEAMRFGVLPGDIIRDRNTGMIFFIRSRVGTTVIAEAQNNYRDTGGGTFVTLEPFETESGGLQFINARLYTPSYLTLGDFAAGSNVATAVARSDGFSTYLNTDVAVGDYLFIDQDADRVLVNGESEVVSIDTAGDTMTFAGNARNSATRKGLTQWIRTPPPNS
ncbi:MAG: hypothetical protein AAGD13_06960 [Pseudomonadota bacterium]